MPSHKTMRTYEKKTRLQLSKNKNSVEAINALFAQNLTKRLKSQKKAKVKLKELPPKVKEYLTDDSLKVDPDNTFDKILKGKVYNKVKLGSFVKVTSSESECSKVQISASFHSPIMTRRRKKNSVQITELSNNFEKSSKIDNDKSSTLDKPITKSLSIEKENKNLTASSLSYIKLPKITENKIVENDKPIFSDTFREKTAVHSSTPCVTALSQKIVADPISPITKSDSSTSSKLMEKSYHEIQQWDEKFPKIGNENTPKRRSRAKRRKLSSATEEEIKKSDDDWKLNCQPKVYLKNVEVSKKTKSKSKSRDSDDDFHGFSRSEQSNSSLVSSRLQGCLECLEESCKNLEKSVPRLKMKSLGNFQKLKVDSKRNSDKSYSKSSRVTTNYILRSSRITRSIKKLSSHRKKPNTKPQRKSSIVNNSLNESVSKYKSDISSWDELIESNNSAKLNSSSPAFSSDNSQSTNSRNTRKIQKNKGIRKSKRLQVVARNNKKSQTSFIKRCSVTSRRQTPTNKSTRILKVCLTPLELKLPQKNFSGKKNYVTVRRRQSRKKKNDSYVEVTDEILSEKEVSYSHSSSGTSFDFSSSRSSNKIRDTTEELEWEEEIALPKTQAVLTVDLKDFDSFMQSYYHREEETEVVGPKVSYVTVDDSETSQKIKECNPEITNIEKSQFLISPGRSNVIDTATSVSNHPEIKILSNVALDWSYNIQSQRIIGEYVRHDHSYASPLKPKSSSQIESETTKNRTPIAKRHDSGLSDIVDSSITDTVPEISQKLKQGIVKLKPGKSYRRSLSLLKRISVIVDAKNSICHRDCVCLKCLFKGRLNLDISRSPQIVPASRKSSNGLLLENYARRSLRYVQSQEEFNRQIDDRLDDSVRNLSLNDTSPNPRRNSSIFDGNLGNLDVSAKDIVLRRCGQTEVLPFGECYPRSALQNCQKIGEGVYGEVFLYRNPTLSGTTVMKIIPIEGDLIVNGERQKKFDEILSEIVIAMELSNLRTNKKNTTSSFNQVQKVRCARGSYPDRLLDLWDLYDETKGSENDSPQIFGENQTYVILELANGGSDLESYVFANAQQAFSVFKQTACALAVAEQELKFEHRDLHWGNLLINTVDKNRTLRFRLDGEETEVKTFGVEVSIIDFTLSRIEFDGVIIYNDLSRDKELFVAQGDYQFEIYRSMQKSNGNEWQHFEPYTNILWLHYLLDKVTVLRYKNPRTKLHKEYLSQLQILKDQVLSFNSVVDFVRDKFI